MTYDDALDMLDNFIQSKTTHGVKSILENMQKICAFEGWSSSEDQQDFAQICTHFDMYVKETGRTSIGRKQFEEWWEVQGTGEAGSFSEEANAEANYELNHKTLSFDLIEDPLPPEMQDMADALKKLDNITPRNYSEDFTDIRHANAYIAGLEADNKHLREQNDKLRAIHREIAALLTKGMK